MSPSFRSRRTFEPSRTASAALLCGVTLLGASMIGCGADSATDVFQSGGAGANTAVTTGSSSGQGGSGQGGSGQGGSGQGGSGQGGSGAGTVGSENCLDGIDNDGDGDTDCADTDCNDGYACVDEAPEGWTYSTTEPADGGEPTPCADGSAPEELFTGKAGPAECSACSCGPLEGASCSMPTLECAPGSNSCNGGTDWSGAFQNGACAKPSLGLNFSLSCRQSSPAAVMEPGSCAPSASDFANKEPFAGRVRACSSKSNGGGCGAGSVCAPKPASATQSLCIRQDGEQACPAGFTKAIQGYQNGTDTRACSACSCASAATCEGGVFRFYDFNGCSAGGDNPIVVDDGTCRNLTSLLDSGSWSVEAVPVMVGGGCTAQGGEPTGEVQTEGAVTFCCQ